MNRHASAKCTGRMGQRMHTLGVKPCSNLDVFWSILRAQNRVGGGQTIVRRTSLATHFTVLLEGVACFSTQNRDGDRQIHTFYYPGDLLGLQSFLFPGSAELSEVHALTDCAIGTIDRRELEEEMQRHPALGLALWRAAMMEANILRQRFLITRRPALERVAHLLCEQLARLGLSEGIIPLNQIDVADAAGLSVVHTNRIFQELRGLGVLSPKRLIEVVNKAHLQELAAFDGRYLDPRESLSRWTLRLET